MPCGDTYLLFDEEDSGEKPHLHIVVSEPNHDGLIVLASVTTRRAKSDTMVCLNPGEHEFIIQPSVVTYAYTKVLTVAKLAEMVGSGEAKPKQRATDTLLKRVQNGMRETDRASYEAKRVFLDFLDQ